MPMEFQGPPPPAAGSEIASELVLRLDAAIVQLEAPATLRTLIGELAADAREHSTPPEALLVLIKSHLWARTSGLDMIARRDLVERSVRWAIEEYYRPR